MTTRFLILVALCGCGSSSNKTEGGDSKGSAKDNKPAPTGDASLLFMGNAVQLPTEIQAAKFGEGKADTLKAVGADSTYHPSKAAAKTSYDFTFDKAGRLTQIKVAAPVELEPILTKQWGKPIKNKKGEAFWFAADKGLRAWLPDYGKGKAVTFSQYEPVTKLLGGKGFALAFAEGKPLFGATIDELHTAWGTALCDFDREAKRIKEGLEKNAADALYRLEANNMKLRWCPKTQRTVEQFTPLGDVIRFDHHGKVVAIDLSIPTGGSAELQTQVIADLDAKFGTPVEVTADKVAERHYFDPAAKMRARVRVGEQSVNVEVGPYLPVAELIGGDKPGLSVETASMPGGTFEQIAKEDPAHYRKMGTMSSLFFPPTDYNQWETEVQLDIMANEKNTYGYTVVVHHQHNEKAGDEVMKLLEAKFGPGKKDPKSTDADTTYNFAKNGRKVAARRVSQQWQLRVTK